MNDYSIPEGTVWNDEDFKKCNTCYGYGLWGIGDPCPMGPSDARDGCPTKECPECGANPNG